MTQIELGRKRHKWPKREVFARKYFGVLSNRLMQVAFRIKARFSRDANGAPVQSEYPPFRSYELVQDLLGLLPLQIEAVALTVRHGIYPLHSTSP